MVLTSNRFCLKRSATFPLRVAAFILKDHRRIGRRRADGLNEGRKEEGRPQSAAQARRVFDATVTCSIIIKGPETSFA